MLSFFLFVLIKSIFYVSKEHFLSSRGRPCATHYLPLSMTFEHFNECSNHLLLHYISWYRYIIYSWLIIVWTFNPHYNELISQWTHFTVWCDERNSYEETSTQISQNAFNLYSLIYYNCSRKKTCNHKALYTNCSQTDSGSVRWHLHNHTRVCWNIHQNTPPIITSSHSSQKHYHTASSRHCF